MATETINGYTLRTWTEKISSDEKYLYGEPIKVYEMDIVEYRDGKVFKNGIAVTTYKEIEQEKPVKWEKVKEENGVKTFSTDSKLIKNIQDIFRVAGYESLQIDVLVDDISVTIYETENPKQLHFKVYRKEL